MRPTVALVPALILAHAVRAEPEPIPPEVALAGMQEAYRAGPVADRVLVTFVDALGQRATDQLIVRVHARPPTGSPIVSMDLGRLHVSATGGRLAAVHDLEATTCFVANLPDPVTPDSLASVLPPIPAPQVALALAGAPVVATPYTPNVRFRSAELHDDTQPPVITLEGRSDLGPVTLTLDAASGRIRRLDAELARGGSSATLTLDCVPIDPGDSTGWIVDTGARRPVARLAELTRRPRDIGVGDAAPNIRALSLDLESWSLLQAVGNADEAHHVLLIAFRTVGEGEPNEQIRRDALAAVDAIGAALEGDHAPLRVHAVTALDLAEVELPPIRAAAEQWVAAVDARRSPVFDRTLRWTSDGARALDAFDPAADALAILVGPDRRVAGVLSLDSMADRPQNLATEMAGLLAPLATGPPEQSRAPGGGDPPDAAQEEGGPDPDPPPPLDR